MHLDITIYALSCAYYSMLVTNIEGQYWIHPIVPGAVVGLKLSPSNSTDERISLTWSPPLRPNGVLIAYEVSYRPTDSSQPHHTRRNTTHLATSFTTGELEMGTEYNLSVRAYTSAGPGQSSSVVVASTLDRRPCEIEL